MGRFFQASDSKYVDDFIYTPPWELIAGITQKQDQNVQTSLDTMEVMRNLPINYWKGVDDERAKAVKAEWEQKVNDVSQKVSKDYLNPANRAEIMNLKSQLNKDVTSGNISKLQANATAYNDLVAKASLIKDDATRAKYLEDLPKKYLKDNPEGAYSSIFKPGELQQHRNIPGEFINYFRDKKPQVFSSVMDKVNGRWVVKDSSEKTQSLVGDLFQEFIGANTDIKGYMQHRQNSGIFDETYFNEDGTYNTDPNSTFSNMNNFVQNESYTQERKGRELDVNQVAENDASRAHQTSERLASQAYQDKVRREEQARETMKAAREGKNSGLELIVGNDKNTKVFAITAEGKKTTQEYLANIAGYMNTPGMFKNEQEKQQAMKTPITWALNMATKSNIDPVIRTGIMRLNEAYSTKAGTNKLVTMGFNDTQIKEITTAVNSKQTNNLVAKNKGYLTTDKGFHLLGSQQVSLPTLKGRTFRDSDGQTKQIYAVEVLEDSNYIGTGDLLSSKVRVYTGVPSTAGMGKTNSLGKPDKNSYIDFDFNQPNRSEILTINIPNY